MFQVCNELIIIFFQALQQLGPSIYFVIILRTSLIINLQWLYTSIQHIIRDRAAYLAIIEQMDKASVSLEKKISGNCVILDFNE